MENKISKMLESKQGSLVYDSVNRYISQFGMDVTRGILVGFSGGPDSVMLLSVLARIRRQREFKLLAVHINHCIRGQEADRDEAFSRRFAEALNVEFFSFKINVPQMATELGVGVEEAARNARYSKFSDIMLGRNDVGYIAVAHNATDNLETMLFNMMRGAGTRGMCGIPPVRGNIIRPLIYVPKSDILSLLNQYDIGYVCDSTNDTVDYTRNYIRHNVLPALTTLAKVPEKMSCRTSRILRADDDYLCATARQTLQGRTIVSVEELSNLHPAIRARVLRLMACESDVEIYENHIEKLTELLMNGTGNFSYAVHGGFFVVEYGNCRFVKKIPDNIDFSFEISDAVTRIPEFGAMVCVGEDKFVKSSSNVYNFSIQADITSAIIEGGLSIRSKRDGDTVFYGGHTRKLKKLFCDAKIPASKRSLIPILCDEKGIVWVPGFGVRDDGGKEPLHVTIYCSDEDKRFWSGEEFIKKLRRD